MNMYRPVPKVPDFPAMEREILRFWEDRQIFQKLRAQTAEGPRWSFLDGPITANNPMGVHHAWGRSLKDMYQRYHAMNGHALRYQNGFDCQGLWVEVEVEKSLGLADQARDPRLRHGEFRARLQGTRAHLMPHGRPSNPSAWVLVRLGRPALLLALRDALQDGDRVAHRHAAQRPRR